MSNTHGKSSQSSTPTGSSNGYQPTQPAQQKFTSQIAQPLQHAAPSAATAQLSGALAGSPSWMTPPAAHTPFQLPANLPGIQHPGQITPTTQPQPGSPLNGITNGYRQVTQPQPITHLAPNPQQGTTNPPPNAPAGGGMTALAPGNLPPSAQPGQAQNMTQPTVGQQIGGYGPGGTPEAGGLYTQQGQYIGPESAPTIAYNQPMGGAMSGLGWTIPT